MSTRTHRPYKMIAILFACTLLGLSALSGCGTKDEKCKSAVDCLGDQVCQEGACVDKSSIKCKSNADCQEPKPLCDANSGQCKSQCENNSDCASAQVCQSNKCVRDPSIECISSAECKNRELCDNGVCKESIVQQCKEDKDCADKAYKFCDTKNNCAWECKQDSDCSNLQKCTGNACVDSGECRDDGDCRLPTGKCDLQARACVSCLSSTDCPADKTCKDSKCEDKPGCASDNDCQKPNPKCNTATGKCFECVADGDCQTGEKCEQNKCKAAAGCQPACKAGATYCFAGERCLPEWKKCSEDKDCAATEACIDPGSGKVCLTRCDPTKNTSQDDEHNAACEAGYGFCIPSSRTDATQGVCLPPYKKLRPWKASCQNLGNPQKADYHDCKDADTVCVNDGAANFCWKTCDPKKNPTPGEDGKNADCEGGQGNCVVLADDSGVCEPIRPKTQKDGEGCLLLDPLKPEWADCGPDLLCVNNKCAKTTQSEGQDCNTTDKLCKPTLACIQFDSTKKVALCKAKCDPRTPTCAAGFACSGISNTNPSAGACAEERKKTRKQGEECQGSDPRQPEWNDCDQDASCTSGKCGAPRSKTRNKGETCNLTDTNDPGFHTCKAGLACWSNVCLSTCDPTASGGCGTEEKCVVLNANRPKEGVCRSFQGLECEPQKTPCATGYTCFKFSFAYRCVKSCDPTASNTCLQDHTCQRADKADPKKGHCILDRLPRHPKGAPCHFSRPEDPQYHGCKAPLVCIELSCVDAPPATGIEGDACDKTKGCQAPLVCTPSDAGTDTCARPCNPFVSGQCKTGEICVPKKAEKFDWTGGCFQTRTKTQPLGSPCKRSNATRADYNDCAGTAACVGAGGETFCRDACDPTKTPSTCATTHTCITYTTGKGACIKTRLKNRNANDECGSDDESVPAYNDCSAGLICVTFDSVSKLKLCVNACNPQQATCPAGGPCAGVDLFDPTKGACIPPKNDDRQLGEPCAGKDPRTPAWHKCANNAHCKTDTQVCVACLTDAHCTGGNICKANACLAPNACVKDSECSTPTPRCDIAAKKCVGCLIDGDCPTGQSCQANACKTAPGCTTDANCAAPTAKCLILSKKCVACLADADCPNGQACTANKCIPRAPACSPACQTDELCFNSQRCLPKWKSCTATSQCSQNETCVRIGTAAVCTPNCDPATNTSTTDRTNSACYGGYGFCLSLGQPNLGACVPPRLKLRDLNQSCLAIDMPDKPEYHDCKTGLECWQGVCLKERTKTQPADSKCNRNGSGPEHNDCATGNLCISSSDGGYCRKSCTIGATGTCPTSYTCRALQGSTTDGVCVKQTQNTRKVDETCLNPDVSDPGYNACTTGLRCISFDSSKGYNLCARECDTANPTCPTDFTCATVTSGSTNGACLRDRKRLRKTGETCAGPDPLKPDWHDCVKDFGCVNNKCVSRTQNQGQTCSTTNLCKEALRCIIMDQANNLSYCFDACNPQQSACPRDFTCAGTSSTDPTRGACIPDRKNTRTHSQSCGASDITKPEYNDCLTSLICMGTQAQGYHCLDRCNPSSPNCKTGFSCVRTSATNGACSQTCTGVSTCNYGSVCTDPGTSLGFNICL